MADFFTRVVEHTLGTMPTIQPVITPLFAPDSVLERNASNTAFTEVHTFAESDIFSAGELSRSGIDTAMYDQPAVQFAYGRPMLYEQTEAPFSRRERGQSERNALPAIQPLVSPLNTRPDTPVPVNASSQHAQNSEEQPRSHGLLHEEMQVSPPVRVEETTKEKVTVQSAGMLTLRDETSQKDISPGSQSPSTEHTLAASQILPAIHVSIGRIEVRAVLPPAQPSPRPLPSRPSSALSLDDYLKQQKGGKR